MDRSAAGWVCFDLATFHPCNVRAPVQAMLASVQTVFRNLHATPIGGASGDSHVSPETHLTTMLDRLVASGAVMKWNGR